MTDIDDSILLTGYPRGLSQIVTNLINNALEASEGTKISITVKLINVESKKGMTRFIIELPLSDHTHY